MITPQQIDQISFSQTRHGYDMEQVDKILEPLTEDYVTLYKENALLKSKMRVLVGKLEEYRKNEAAAQNAMESARASAEKMIQDAKAQAAQLVRQAQAQAQTIVDNAVADANSVRQGSIQYTDDMLKSLQTIMNHTMEGAQGRFDAFMNSMKSSYDIVSSNRKELSTGIITEKEEAAEPETENKNA